MKIVAALAAMMALSGCAALSSGPARYAAVEVAAAPTAPEAAARAPRRSQQELLAAYWAERRAPRPVLTSDFTARSRTALQNFPGSTDSEDQSHLDVERLERESAATRATVQAALRR